MRLVHGWIRYRWSGLFLGWVWQQAARVGANDLCHVSLKDLSGLLNFFVSLCGAVVHGEQRVAPGRHAEPVLPRRRSGPPAPAAGRRAERQAAARRVGVGRAPRRRHLAEQPLHGDPVVRKRHKLLFSLHSESAST